MFEAKLYFFTDLRWLEFKNMQANRAWSFLETSTDFTQLCANLDLILNCSDIYIEWKKRLIQGCAKFEQVTAWKVSKKRSFFWSVFSCVPTNTRKYGPEKTPHLDTFHAVGLATNWVLTVNIFGHL